MDPEHPSPRSDDRPADLSILTTIERELADVERALQRLDEGSYGTCQVCGAVIADSELAAAPATSCCAQHQQGA